MTRVTISSKRAMKRSGVILKSFSHNIGTGTEDVETTMIHHKYGISLNSVNWDGNITQFLLQKESTQLRLSWEVGRNYFPFKGK